MNAVLLALGYIVLAAFVIAAFVGVRQIGRERRDPLRMRRVVDHLAETNDRNELDP